jgi:chemotaxis protein methyltransferase CheR
MLGPSYDHLCNLLKESSGLELSGQKAYLVASRLSPVAQKRGFRGVLDLLDHLQARPTAELVSSVVEAMATHESLFFRDGKPFELLRDEVLPELVRKRHPSPVRIWSAACSSGQEPYSIAMCVLESLQGTSRAPNVEIVATDISRAVLERARSGVYSGFEASRGLSPERLRTHFDIRDGSYSAKSALRSLVEFQYHNLLDDARRLGRFDIVFCRNVLIYFARPAKEKALGEIARVLARDGALFVGTSETMLGTSVPFARTAGHNWYLRPA